MMQELFGTLTNAVAGAPAVALAAALAWGVASVILSPCHLASIPLIVGFIAREGAVTPRRAFGASALFAAGILITIAAVGAATAGAGRIMGDLGPYVNYVVAAVFVVVGLNLMDVIPNPFFAPNPSVKRKGHAAAFMLGLVFGLVLGPCTFAYMAPILAVAFKAAATRPAHAVLLVAMYGVGHTSVIVLAGTSSTLVQRLLNWNEMSRGTVIIKRACGALVLAGAVYLVYTAP